MISGTFLSRSLVALAATACLASIGMKSLAQQPSAPVPSIEELKRQLEAKRLEQKRRAESRRPPDAKPQPEAEQAPLKPPVEHPKSVAVQTSSQLPTPPGDAGGSRQIPKNVPAVKLDANSTAALDACPYPAAARSRGETGTVVLLIYVTPDGHVTDTSIETSSSSTALDEGAANCVKEYGYFLPKRTGARAEASWFRMKFKWSFGDF